MDLVVDAWPPCALPYVIGTVCKRSTKMRRYIKAGLATKGLILIIVPCIAQVICLIAMTYLMLDIEFLPLRIQQERLQQFRLTQFVIADQKLLMEINLCILQQRIPGKNCRQAKDNLVAVTRELISGFHTKVDKLIPVLGIDYFFTDLAQLRKTSDEQAKACQVISASAVKAYDESCEFFAGAGAHPSRTRFAEALARAPGSDWHVAITQLNTMLNQRALATNYYPSHNSAGRSWREVLTICSTASLLVMLCGVILFLQNVSARLKLVLENSNRFSSGRLLNPPLGGRDELALLDQSFHYMAEQLSRSSREQTAIIDNARDLICSTAANGKIVKVNSAAREVLGISAGELIGRALLDFIAPDDKSATADNLRLAMGKGDIPPFETRAVMKNGKIVDVLCSAVWSEEAQALFCVFHDITHKKMAERLQRQAVEVACHQLKEPIVAVADFNIQLSRSQFGPLKEGAQKLIGSVKTSTDRMLTLVRDLDDCEMIDAGVVHIEPTWFNVSELLQSTVAAVEQQARQVLVTVEAEPTPLKMCADRNRLLQVAINLTTNALKFSPAQTVVRLSARTTGNGVQIMVADQGRGIPASAVASIFERFSQVRQTDSKVKGGSGLGLAICKSLVELHGGTIKVESEENVGSVFSFTIPNAALAGNKS